MVDEGRGSDNIVYNGLFVVYGALFRFTPIFFDEHLISGGIFSDIGVVVTYGIQVYRYEVV